MPGILRDYDGSMGAIGGNVYLLGVNGISMLNLLTLDFSSPYPSPPSTCLVLLAVAVLMAVGRSVWSSSRTTNGEGPLITSMSMLMVHGRSPGAAPIIRRG